MKINEEVQTKQSNQPRNKTLLNWFQKINRLFIRINRLFIPPNVKITNQTTLKEWERERITQVLVHSLPKLHPVLRNLLRFHYVTNNRLQTHTHQQIGDLDLSRTHTLFDKPHTKSEHPLTSQYQQFTDLQTWKQLQKKAGKITPDSRNYSWTYSTFKPMQSQSNLAILNPIFHKSVFESLFPCFEIGR